MKNILIIAAVIIVVGGVLVLITRPQAPAVPLDGVSVAWQDVELTDVNTGNTFKISDYKGKPVLVETFAVWCPTCTKQQKETKKFHDEVGDAVISVSLDTDPNEDVDMVLAHTRKNGFDWLYAVAPVEMTQSLIAEFGVGIVNAPSVPLILVCEDQSTRFLKSGVKNAERLKSEIEKGCGV